MFLVKPLLAGFFRVTARESEQGFCVKASRKPVGCILAQPVLQSLPGDRSARLNIRIIVGRSSSMSEELKANLLVSCLR